jgi:hypothetical protein
VETLRSGAPGCEGPRYTRWTNPCETAKAPGLSIPLPSLTRTDEVFA